MANEVEKRLKLKYLLDDMPTKNNLKSSLGKSALQAGVGVGLGCAIAAILGKPSFYGGFTLMVAGNYMENKLMPAVGLGMMAYSLADKPAEGSTVKERIKGLGTELMSKTYLDKVVSKFKNKNSAQTTEGLGALEAARSLDDLEADLIASATAYNSQVSGYTEEPDMSNL